MKIPTPRKLSSGNWFIQLRLGGESVPVTESTEKKCVAAARLIKAEYLAGKRAKSVEVEPLTVRQAIDNYIASRNNALSPSTIHGYHIIRDNRFPDIMDAQIGEIKDWQSICNDEAKRCAAKTLQNSWRFIASVLRYSELPVPRVTLPQVVANERPYLEPEQIPVFVKALKGRECEIAALLALHGLRKSEILALTWDKIELGKNRIFVDGALVPDGDHVYVRKPTNKNKASRRYVPIMIPELKKALEDQSEKSGTLINCAPNALRTSINRVCREIGLPLVGVHGLRHSFASLAYHLNMPEKLAMQIGGWADFDTMRKIYTHLAERDVKNFETEMSAFFANPVDNANDNANNTT